MLFAHKKQTPFKMHISMKSGKAKSENSSSILFRLVKTVT